MAKLQNSEMQFPALRTVRTNFIQGAYGLLIEFTNWAYAEGLATRCLGRRVKARTSSNAFETHSGCCKLTATWETTIGDALTQWLLTVATDAQVNTMEQVWKAHVAIAHNKIAYSQTMDKKLAAIQEEQTAKQHVTAVQRLKRERSKDFALQSSGANTETNNTMKAGK